MNIDDLKQILDIVREHEITEFELEEQAFKLRIRRNGYEASSEGAARSAGPEASLPVQPVAVEAPSAAGPRPPAASPAPAAEPGEISGAAIVKSPIVGTFYRAPEPGARAFVDVGTKVRKGQVLCIIEAMKLMNEINSEFDGEVAAIYAENGQPVQYGERLFAIKH